MSDVTLRPAEAGDRDFLVAATGRLADFPVPAWRTPDQIAAADRRHLLAAVDRPGPETLVLIAEAGAARLGCLFATTATDFFDGRSVGHVEVVVVTKEAQGRGVGRTLLEGAERWAVERGYRLLTLNAFRANSHARAVYEHLGYQPEIVKYVKVL